MKHYPERALQCAKGVATVGFVLDRSGGVASVVLLRSSGEADLDAESLALVNRAAPFPPPPGAQRSFAIEVGSAWDIEFSLYTELYGKTIITEFNGGDQVIAPSGSADFVLTFRNMHDWMRPGTAEAAFRAFYTALKPGGILGLEDHRGRPDQPQDPQAKSGYVRQDYAIALAEQAGFKLIGSSEVNANPKDTKDYPEGVWTLPPTYRLKDQDRQKYTAIGESDRFVLKFQKPSGAE